MPSSIGNGTVCYFCKGFLKQGKRVDMVIGQAQINQGVIYGNIGDASHKWRIVCAFNNWRRGKKQ